MEKRHFKGCFKILDYNISHKVLLLRNNENVESDQNIDLIFESVFYLELPTRIENVIVYQADEDLINELRKRYNGEFYPQFNQTFFVLESNGRKYFIGCCRIIIQNNSLDPLNSSIR